MSPVRKGMCPGCPWNYGDPATETAYNLGCLPSPREAVEHVGDGAWPCHDEPEKVCCGFVAEFPERRDAPLKPMPGVHQTGDRVDDDDDLLDLAALEVRAILGEEFKKQVRSVLARLGMAPKTPLDKALDTYVEQDPGFRRLKGLPAAGSLNVSLGAETQTAQTNRSTESLDPWGKSLNEIAPLNPKTVERNRWAESVIIRTHDEWTSAFPISSIS